MTSPIVLDIDPTGVADARPEIIKAQTASLKDPAHPPLHFPGTPDSEYVVSDTLNLDARVPLEGAGWIKRDAHWAGIVNGQGHHLAVYSNSTATAVIKGVGFDGNAAAQDPGFVGDTLRFQHVDGVDLTQVYTRNMRGLTTSSTPTLPETFALQLLHVKRARLAQCHSWNADGAPTATGIVFHWVDDGVLSDTLVAYFPSGQAIGTFGAGRVVIDHCGSLWSRHGINCEAGNAGQGALVTVPGGDRASYAAGCNAALVVNGNYGNPLSGLVVDDYNASACGSLLDVTGVPSPVSVRRVNVVQPSLAVVRALVGTDMKANAWAKGIHLDGKVSKPASIPVFTRGAKTLIPPKTWALS